MYTHQPVEHVVHVGAGEGLPELLPVPGLGERHDDVGDARPDVGAHDHRDGRPDRGPGAHQAHDDGGGGGGGLDEHRDQDPDHQPHHWVLEQVRVGEEGADVATYEYHYHSSLFSSFSSSPSIEDDHHHPYHLPPSILNESERKEREQTKK